MCLTWLEHSALTSLFQVIIHFLRFHRDCTVIYILKNKLDVITYFQLFIHIGEAPPKGLQLGWSCVLFYSWQLIWQVAQVHLILAKNLIVRCHSGKCPDAGRRSELAASRAEPLASPSAVCSPKEMSQGFRVSAVGRIQTLDWHSTPMGVPSAAEAPAKACPFLVTKVKWPQDPSPPSGQKAQALIAPVPLKLFGLTQTSPHVACCAWKAA